MTNQIQELTFNYMLRKVVIMLFFITLKNSIKDDFFLIYFLLEYL